MSDTEREYVEAKAAYDAALTASQRMVARRPMSDDTEQEYVEGDDPAYDAGKAAYTAALIRLRAAKKARPKVNPETLARELALEEQAGALVRARNMPVDLNSHSEAWRRVYDMHMEEMRKADINPAAAPDER